MIHVQKIVLLAVASAVLAACGSGGSGSGVANPTTPTPTPTPTVTKANGAATYAAGKYTYTVAGESPIDLTLSGFNVAGTIKNSGGQLGTLKTVGNIIIGGTPSYSRYGAYSDINGVKLDTFATGVVSTDTPTTGTAAYKGLAVRAIGKGASNLTSSPMAFNVDFGAKTIAGTTSAGELSNVVSINGTIAGAAFSGTANAGTAAGTFKGNFYGPAAAELAGTANFTDIKNDVAFGGKKQ